MSKRLERKGWNWSPVPAEVILSHTLSHADVRVYAYLLWRSGNKGQAWPNVDTIASDLHMSNAAVRLTFRSLISQDWIRRERHVGRSSTTFIFETQKDCREFSPSANLLADDELTGKPTISQQDSRLNESQLTRVKGIARGKTPRAPDPEIMNLSQKFVSLTGIQWLEPKSARAWKEANRLWLTPLKEMLTRANGQSESVLAAAVKQMRKDGLTIHAPYSVLKVFVSINGEKCKSASHAAPDPFAGFYDMMERKKHENIR